MRRKIFMARPGLRNHPKFRRLRSILNMPDVYVQAHLEAMWLPGYENGIALLGDEIDVELAAEWEHSGRAKGEWFKAVLECRWIDCVTDTVTTVTGSETPLRYAIHDLFDHAPGYVFSRKDREDERRGTKLCEVCRNAFKSPQPNARYCSSACRQKAFRESRNEVRNEPLQPVTDRNITPAPAPAPAPAPLIPYIPTEGFLGDSLRGPAREQFGQWSQVQRGHGLNEAANEHKPIHDLIDTAAQQPPIVRAGQTVPRETLVALAAEMARKDGKPFKSAKYAAAIVRSMLDEWALKGMPGEQANGTPRAGYKTREDRIAENIRDLETMEVPERKKR